MGRDGRRGGGAGPWRLPRSGRWAGLAWLLLALAACDPGPSGSETVGDTSDDTSDVAGEDSGDTGLDIDGTGLDVVSEQGPGGLPLIAVRVPAAELAELHGRDEGSDGYAITARVQMLGDTWPKVTMQLHGGLSRSFPKKSYRLTFPDDDEPEVPWFSGRPEEHRRLVLHASWIDPTWMRNKLTMDVVSALGGLAPRMSFVWLRVNGQDMGLYVAIERIDRPFLKRRGLHRDGNVYKAVDHRANWAKKAAPMNGYELKVNEDNPTDDLGELLATLSDTPATQAAFEAEVEPVLDLDAFMLWQAVHTFADNRDTFTKNYYLYHDLAAPPGTEAAAFELISWDADATFGLNWDGAPAPPRPPSWHGSDAFSPRLFAIAAYRAEYRARYLAALDGALSEAALLSRVEAMAAAIEQAAKADLALWDRDADFEDAVDALRAFVSGRRGVMRPLLEGL